MKNIKSTAEFISFYIFSFFIYCFIGWVYEVITMYAFGYGFVNRGFLYGCYIPIYGFASLFFLLTLSKMVKKKFKIKNIPVTPIMVFLAVFVMSSIIEYASSYILETVFHLKLWDYSGYEHNLNGRISLKSSIYFGIGGLIIFYIVQPLLDKLRRHMKSEITIIIGLIIAVIMTTDFIITVSK